MAKRDTAQRRGQLVKEIFGVLRRRHEIPDRTFEGHDPSDLIETILLAILAEDADEQLARQCFIKLKDSYFDWNELRVSPIQEILEHIGELPNAEQKARFLKRALHHIFETVYSFKLDAWVKKGIGEIEKHCGKQEWFTPFVRARVVRDCLRRKALPVDGTILRVWARIGVVDAGDEDAARKVLERAVPADDCYAFEQVFRIHGLTVCLPDGPLCDQCWVQDHCQAAQAAKAEAQEAKVKVKRRATAAKRRTAAAKRRAPRRSKR